jgi:hypothetical protein
MERSMMKRRDFLAGTAAAALAAPSVWAAGDPKLLKFVPQADIALLDPHFAPALVPHVIDSAVVLPRHPRESGDPGSVGPRFRGDDEVLSTWPEPRKINDSA